MDGGIETCTNMNQEQYFNSTSFCPIIVKINAQYSYLTSTYSKKIECLKKLVAA